MRLGAESKSGFLSKTKKKNQANSMGTMAYGIAQAIFEEKTAEFVDNKLLEILVQKPIEASIPANDFIISRLPSSHWE